MTRLQRIISRCAGFGIVATLLFPPIVEIDASVRAYPRYYFLLAMPELRSGTFLWPITGMLLLLEWALILTFAAVAYWLAGRFGHSAEPDSRGERDHSGEETPSRRWA
jgi:hypothetical protein